MSQLTALRKQIAALEAEATRLTAAQTSAAVVKIKALMAASGVTIEHLVASSTSKSTKLPKVGAATETRAKRSGAGQPKYRDPKSGKTWTGFGRVPGWMATARNRDRFLIDKSVDATEKAAAPASAGKRIAAKKKSQPSSVKVKRSRAAASETPVVEKKQRRSTKPAPAVAAKTPRTRRSPKRIESESAAQATPEATAPTQA